MAKRTDFVKGKTIEQILNMPWNELRDLTESELRVVVGRGVSSANKRLRRYQEKKGKLPTAGRQGDTYEDVKFSTVGKDRKELLEEFKRIKNFMGAETSSLSGEKQVQKKAIDALFNQKGINIGNVNYDRFWKAYDKLKELHPEVADKNFKYAVIEQLTKEVSGKKWFNVDKAVMKIEKKLQELYQNNESIKNGNGTSGFFEV